MIDIYEYDMMSYDAYDLYYETMLNGKYDTLTASTLGLLARITPHYS